MQYTVFDSYYSYFQALPDKTITMQTRLNSTHLNFITANKSSNAM